MSRRSGFTLLEICLALLIGMMLITIAVPSVTAMLAEQRLKKSFEDFDAFVSKARSRSIEERRDYRMIWEEDGIALVPDEARETDDAAAEPERFSFSKGESVTIERPAVLMKRPPEEWVFWRSGLCEEAVISFAGDAGSWTVRYDPLTVRGTFLESAVK